MPHGLRVILGNATIRQFGVGIGVALLIVGAFIAVQRVTADPGAHPDEWLSSAEQADLDEAVQSLASPGDWVAGCLWDGDDKEIDHRVAVPAGPAEYYRGSASTGRTMDFVVVPVTAAAAAPRHAPHQEPGSFCLIPESR